MMLEKEQLVLAIGNAYEFNTRYNKDLSVQELVIRRESKENYAISSEMALFWGGSIDRRVVLLPQQPDPQYVADIERTLKVKIRCIQPRLVTGHVCRDLLADNDQLNELTSALAPYAVVVMPWGVTDHYYELLAVLIDRGITLVNSGGPTKTNQWIVDYCDSKIGSRSILERLRTTIPEFGAPDGFICHNLSEAIVLADTVSRNQHQPLIIKSDIGDGGKGVQLYEALGDNSLLSNLANRDLWINVPVIVETAIGGGTELSTPSFDGIVEPDGSIAVMAVENMLTIERRCTGVETGPNLLPINVLEKILRVGVTVGQQMSSLGYRGWYDVDFLLANENLSLFGSEINARRGGGTAPIEVAQRLFGVEGWQSRFCKSFERFWLKTSYNSYSEVRTIVEQLNSEFSSTHSGVILFSSNSVILHEPYLTYFLFASSVEGLGALENELRLRFVQDIP